MKRKENRTKVVHNPTRSKINEKEIQDYIWNNRYRLHELIDDDYNSPVEIATDKPWKIQPYELIYNNIINEYRKYLYSFENNLTLFANEVGLGKESESTIRADLLGLLQSENGLCVIEVKKSKHLAQVKMIGYNPSEPNKLVS